ncbi:MAG: glycosyltransferase family 39 protein [Bacteroidetes bacterium]|nr:glycosyltransferase family 39 protein [Bacteroidota bacterium]
MKQLLKEHIVFILVLLSCIVLRFIPLFQYQYTLDEWSGLYRTQFSSFSEVIEKGVKIDAHPAFVQILIFYLSKWFGYTDWIIKLPFLLFSIGVIVYAYTFCLRNFTKQAGLIASAIFGYSLLFVYYAPIARMYISGTFFSVALLYHFSEIFFLKNNRRLHYLFIGLYALLSALNQHVSALFALSVCASGFLFVNKQTFKPYLLTCVVTVLLYLPNLPITLYQLGIGGIGFEQGGWLAVPTLNDLWLFIKVLFGTGYTCIFLAFLSVMGFILKRPFHVSRVTVFLLLIFTVNFLVIYLYSVYRAPVFQYSVMMFCATALVLGISSFIHFNNRYLFSFCFIAVSAILIFNTYFKKNYLTQSVKNIFEYQFDRTKELKEKYGDKMVTALFLDADTFMRKVCFERYKKRYSCFITGDAPTVSTLEFSKLVNTCKSDFVVLASSFPYQQVITLERFPYLIESAQTQGLNFKVYSRRKTDKENVVKDDAILFRASPQNPGKFDFRIKKNTPFFVAVDSLNEYPFGGEGILQNMVSKAGQVILLKVKIKLSTLHPKEIAVCISTNDLQRDSILGFCSASTLEHYIHNDSTVTIYTNMFCGNNNLKNSSKIKAYVWNLKKEKFTITDFEILTLDFWPQKWNYWE